MKFSDPRIWKKAKQINKPKTTKEVAKQRVHLSSELGDLLLPRPEANDKYSVTSGSDCLLLCLIPDTVPGWVWVLVLKKNQGIDTVGKIFKVEERYFTVNKNPNQYFFGHYDRETSEELSRYRSECIGIVSHANQIKNYRDGFYLRDVYALS